MKTAADFWGEAAAVVERMKIVWPDDPSMWPDAETVAKSLADIENGNTVSILSAIAELEREIEREKQ